MKDYTIFSHNNKFKFSYNKKSYPNKNNNLVCFSASDYYQQKHALFLTTTMQSVKMFI